MEFWGVEVKPGKPTKIEHEYGRLIHISHASLGEVSKDAGSSISVSIRLKINGKDFVIGTLSPEDRPQSIFDLVFEKAFELSHDWKDGSVYFLGYSVEDPDLDVGELAPEEEEPVETKEIGLLELDNGEAAAAAPPNGSGDVDEEDSDDDEDDDPAEGGDVDEEDSDGDDKAVDESLAGDSSDDLSEHDSEDGDEGDDDSEEEEEELPKTSKKRQASPSAPVFAKKAKSGAQKKRT